MTTDQHNNILNIFYANSLKKTLKYLEENNFILEAIDSDDIEIAEIIKHLSFSKIKFTNYYNVRVKINLEFSSLILAIPETFPDHFPKIYLSKKDFLKIYPIPHLDKNRFICTRDPEVVFLNDEEPGKALKQLIEIAVSIIGSGIKNENIGDFTKEFLAYWSDACKYNFIGLFKPLNKIQSLKIFELSEELFGLRIIIVDNKFYLENWIKPFNITYTELTKAKILFIPLNIFSPFNLNCDGDAQKIIEDQNNSTLKKVLESYFNDGNLLIISSIAMEEDIIVFGWKHKAWKEIRGFRKNRVPLNIRLQNNGRKTIEKINILRLDKNRIFNRGGTILPYNDSAISVLVVGCGSLGSFLTMSLARCGISKFSLVDPETLNPENVPRHLCSFVDASKKMKKVNALEKRIKEQFPYIYIQTYDEDILNLLKNNKIELQNFNMVIITIAKESVERRISYFYRNEEINNMVVHLWIEPYGIGGHMLFIHPKNGGCFNCCFGNDGTFKYSIARSDNQYKKREVGCQSTFLPYSSLDTEQFVNVSCRIILSILSNKPESTMLYTWINNNIESFEKSGYKINKGYETKLPFSITQDKIVKRCNLCLKEKKSI